MTPEMFRRAIRDSRESTMGLGEPGSTVGRFPRVQVPAEAFGDESLLPFELAGEMAPHAMSGLFAQGAAVS
jgi:hypothetical protein